jgi:predicted phage terminase large subunit-like protein
MTSLQQSQQAAAAELLTRRRARQDILHYVNAIEVPGRPVSDDPDEHLFLPIETTLADHHRLLLRKLDETSKTPHGRMMVFMPPGSAKSTYASVVFPTAFLGREPNRKIILASYGNDLARKMGRRARQITRSARFRGIYSCALSADSSAADEWSLTNGSEYMSCGILSGITGNRAHGIIIDDPVKGRQEADSETIRGSIWNAYEDDLKTRLIPGGWIVIIQTRWHEDDLSGRILPDDWAGESGPILCKDGNTWEVVCLQAKCDVSNDPLGRKIGDYLWPEWFDRRHWAQFQSNPRTWSALYQQLPSAQEGTFYKRDWFRRFRTAPAVYKYMTSDHAPAGQDDSDYSCIRVWGIDALGDVYLVDGFRHQETMDKTADRALDLIRKHKPFCWFPEDDNNWKSIAGFVVRMMREQKISCRIEPISPHGSDKQVKSQPAQGMASMGRIWIPEGPEGDDVIDQYCKFPNGRNDDEPDTLAIICRAIDQAHPAIVQHDDKPKTQDRWARSFGDDNEESDSWKTV